MLSYSKIGMIRPTGIRSY